MKKESEEWRVYLIMFLCLLTAGHSERTLLSVQWIQFEIHWTRQGEGHSEIIQNIIISKNKINIK